MANIMYFKNQTNKDLKCVISELPPITRGQARGEWSERPGLDGAQFESDDAIDTVDLPVPIWISPTADVNQAIAWLSGAGNLRFNNWPWFWKARLDAPAVLRPCVGNDGWNTTVTFKAQPHRYLYPEAETFAVANGTLLDNPCTGDALPIIKVTGLGNINLMVGNETLLISNLTQPITIDCEAKIAYGGDIETLMTGFITPAEGWPVLHAGKTAISWSGSATEVLITPRWRWE